MLHSAAITERLASQFDEYNEGDMAFAGIPEKTAQSIDAFSKLMDRWLLDRLYQLDSFATEFPQDSAELLVEQRAKRVIAHIELLLSEEQVQRLRQLVFQRQFHELFALNSAFSELIELSENQKRKLRETILEPGPSRELVPQNAVLEIPKMIPGKGASDRLEDQTAVHIYRLLSKRQKEAVKKAAGKPIEGGWLEFVLKREQK